MIDRTRILRGWSFLALLPWAISLGCSQEANTPPSEAPPAHVAKHIDEQSLNTITLTPRAEERLGIQTVQARIEDVQRHRVLGGEVVIPPGRSIVVSAPLAGRLAIPDSAAIPVPGSHVDEGQTIFDFKPILTPERDVLTPAERVGVAQTRADVATAEIVAEREIAAARIQVEAAKVALDRAIQLLKDRAGSQQAVDEAEAQWKLAKELLTTAEVRHRFLAALELDEQPGALASRPITAPVSGVLQSVESAAGETVAMGDVLFQIVQLDPIWIRVPVYVGHYRDIDTRGGVVVAEYGQATDAAQRRARYVVAPPAANPLATTVDLFFELDNHEPQLFPGQRVSLTLPMHSRDDRTVIPFEALLYDIHGGTWVYERIAPHAYARKRVALEHVEPDQAVLASGLESGAEVVTSGAAELFGTEFGVGH